MPEPVETADPDGVDYGRVMQLTFIWTIIVGAPVVALLSVFADLPTWTDRATFAVQVGALVWFVTSICVFLYERRRARREDDGDEQNETTDDGEAVDDGESTTDGVEADMRAEAESSGEEESRDGEASRKEAGENRESTSKR